MWYARKDEYGQLLSIINLENDSEIYLDSSEDRVYVMFSNPVIRKLREFPDQDSAKGHLKELVFRLNAIS